jgi:L-glutamine-phosphate cytidylyltransferase
MKAIILAAGRGSRLGPQTDDRPKCLVTLGGKSLLSYQLDALHDITQDIVVVRGYKADEICVSGVRFVDNPDYATCNTVGSLMKARHEFVGDCLVCYSDLVYEPRLIKALSAAHPSVGVAVDTSFEAYWKARWGSTECDSESLTIDADGHIRGIGQPDPAPDEIDGRFIGLLSFDDAGSAAFREVYDYHAKACTASMGPWYAANSFDSAAMTDMCQAMIDFGIDVTAVPVERGWIEVDTLEDHRRYEQWISDGRMQHFCKAFGNRRGEDLA